MKENYQTDEKIELLPENDPDYKGRIGARGYGLDAMQQEEIARLWQWQENSLKSDIVLGGPPKEEVWPFN